MIQGFRCINNITIGKSCKPSKKEKSKNCSKIQNQAYIKYINFTNHERRATIITLYINIRRKIRYQIRHIQSKVSERLTSLIKFLKTEGLPENLNDVVWLRSGGESKGTAVGFLVVVFVVVIIEGGQVHAGAALEGGEEGGDDGGAEPARRLIQLLEGSRAEIGGGRGRGVDAAAFIHGLSDSI